MLTLTGSAMVYATDTIHSHSITMEDDGEGGTRNMDVQSATNTYVMLRQSDGSERPLILAEILPQVQGVIIVAEGAGDINVQDALIRAAHTVLGIGVHRVSVLQLEISN
jgi:stage III sporulation protein AG